ncbi:hypothetical protein NCC78_03725, partial [Micromonospora phytophila]|nr:hypothetical protein [Micromonospora phytophila]
GESTGATGGGGTPTGAAPSASATPSSGAPTPSAGTAGVPQTPEQRTEQLRGLCRSYLARPPAQREDLLDTPAYAALVTAAGGREKVGDHCRELLPEAEPEKPTKGRSSPSPAAPPTPGADD